MSSLSVKVNVEFLIESIIPKVNIAIKTIKKRNMASITITGVLNTPPFGSIIELR